MRNIVDLALQGFPARRQLGSFLALQMQGRAGVRKLAASVDVRTVMLAAAFIGPIALFVPWLSLDGHAAPLSGVGLMTYAIGGNDRSVMWRISPLATAAVMAVPFTIATAVCLTTLNVLTRNHRLDAPIFTVVGTLLLLRFATPILDAQTFAVWRFAVPGPGLVILMVTAITVVVCTGVVLRGERRSNSAGG